jgi:coenzyme F420-0:L-glutamate ligase
MIVKPIKTRIYKEKEDITAFIQEHVKRLPEKSVLVVTSKIVALGEGRTVFAKSKSEKRKIVKRESDAVLQTKLTTLTLKDGMLMAAGGVDESNADGKMVLLPKDSYKSAEKILTDLRKIYKVKDLGILITDSRTTPLRQGVTGVATGFAGFLGIRDYRGKKDIFGRDLVFTTTNIPDCLATAAVLVMGEGNERYPLALISDAPINFTNKKTKKDAVSIAIEEDLYKPLLKPLLKKLK